MDHENIIMNTGKVKEMCKEPGTPELIRLIGESIGKMAAGKNVSYGDSYIRTTEFIRLVFPDGIKPEQYHLLAPIIRWWDKTNRLIAKPNAYGESPRIDMVGYAILDAVSDIRHKIESGVEVNLDFLAQDKPSI